MKHSLYWRIYESPVGKLKIACTDNGVTQIACIDKNCTETTLIDANGRVEDKNKANHPLLLQTIGELEQYFAKRRRCFDIPLDLQGTSFQIDVWNALINIPYGQTKSYGTVAIETGNKNAARAVGFACKKNPVLIIVPCHRVLGSGNKLTGFNIGIDKKKYLLNHENQKI